MKLEGSCHCGAVTFTVDSKTPYPYMHCYCGMCRKTNGGTGATINLSASADTLDVRGIENVSIYRAKAVLQEGKPPTLVGNLRHFCRTCGCHLWAWDPKWPTYLYPLASAIDTPLPEPPQRYHIMLNSKAPWAYVPEQSEGHHRFDEYPDSSIEDWHKKRDLRQ